MDEREVIYESPDGGKTITKRKLGEYEKEIISQDAVKFVEDKCQR